MEKYLEQTKQQGFCIVENIFPSFYVDMINKSIDNYLLESHDGIVYEKNTSIVRAIHGLHLFDPFFMELAKTNFLLDFAREYLSDDIYIHQYKINMKAAMDGQSWPWHQDYVYWKEGDYIESPRLINIAVALDDIPMLSGPLCFIPGSHRFGDLTKNNDLVAGDWSKDVSANLTYQIDKKVLTPLIENHGYEFVVCKAGDLIIFDPQLAHSSSNNLSPFERRLLLVNYNAVSNAPTKKSKRPAFLSSVDFSPLSNNPCKSKDDQHVMEVNEND
jgi:ectoine hydroxylase